MLILNNKYWIDTVNYGVLKAIYKEAGDKKVGYFLCDLTDGYMVLNNGIKAYSDRSDNDIDKPIAPSGDYVKEEWENLGWKR
jgi:hypothetical protein